MSNRLGNYDLIQPLGAGPHGQVLLAVDTVRDRMVAVKRMPTLKTAAAERRDDLEAAFRRIADIDGAGIGAAYSLSPERSPVPYVVRAHVNGLTLTQLSAHAHAVTPAFLAALVTRLAGALAAFHRRGTAHGNVKPTNVFLEKSGDVVLVDACFWGPLLVGADPDSGLLGDPAYAPASQLEHGLTTPAGDLHALRALVNQLAAVCRDQEGAGAIVALCADARTADALVEAAKRWLTQQGTDDEDVLFATTEAVSVAFLMADVSDVGRSDDAPKLAAPPAGGRAHQTLTPPKDFDPGDSYELGGDGPPGQELPRGKPAMAPPEDPPAASPTPLQEPEAFDAAGFDARLAGGRDAELPAYDPRDIGEITDDEPSRRPLLLALGLAIVLVGGAITWHFTRTPPQPQNAASAPTPPAPRPLTAEELLQAARTGVQTAPDTALEAAEAAAAANPDVLEAHQLLAKAASAANRPDRAAVGFQRAIQLAPNDVELRRGLIEALLAQKLPADAMVAAREALTVHGSDARLHMLLARGALAAHALDEALAALETTTKLAPDNGEAWFLLGEVLRKQGDYPSARGAYEKSVRYRPRFGPGYAALGQTLLKLGRGGEAVGILTTGLKLAPESPEILYLVGRITLREGRNSEAQAQLERYVAARPSDWRGRFTLGLALLRQGKPEPALQQFEAAAALNPESPELQFDLAAAQTQLGAHALALAALDASIDARRNLWLAHCERGRTLVHLGRLDDARKAFGVAATQNPGNALATRLASPQSTELDAAMLVGLPCGPPDLDLAD